MIFAIEFSLDLRRQLAPHWRFLPRNSKISGKSLWTIVIGGDTAVPHPCDARFYALLTIKLQCEKKSAHRVTMIKLRERLDTLEALMAAIEGYHHLPIDVLSQFLLDHYTVDLDVLAQFAEAAESANAQGASSYAAAENRAAAQSAA
ncbi:hypothetical protein [Labrenzia sp. THAF35]|uniref:hypothetical protein n=1 Tax=Labrenzia sp. THAF35 TaxID=2587854 RepID=UPI0012690E79|nr:hypothetical protein [Labrenzia sp. THAF35]